MIDKIVKYLESKNESIYLSDAGFEYINLAQELISRERLAAYEDRHIVIPGVCLYLINNSSINAFATKIDDKYCIFVNKGIIEEQKTFLETLNWAGLNITDPNAYIESMIKYGFLFIVFHEYGHIFCGHLESGLYDAVDMQAKECEADKFSMDYLIKYTMLKYTNSEWTDELKKIFLAEYFLLDKMQKQNFTDYYNGRLMQNYYDKDIISKRDHPLDYQRIMYLFAMLNIVVIKDTIEPIAVKECCIHDLKILKNIDEDRLEFKDNNYLIVKESIDKLMESVNEIRKKIPRFKE